MSNVMGTTPAETLQALLAADSLFRPESVAGPRLVYGEGPVRLTYLGHTDLHVRVTFDRWDAARVSRGEHSPYPEPPGPWAGIYTVENSQWLRQRYEYESRHYGSAYNFNNDVREMLDEFDHYLFCFHDEFVEVIAGGVWFESSERPFNEEATADIGSPGRPHPLADLPASATVEKLDVEGIICQIRRDPRPIDELVAASRLCDQSLYQLALELDGDARVSHRLTIRTRRGETKSRWRGYFGQGEKTFPGVAALAEIRPLISQFAAEVTARRRKMGK